MTTSTKAVARAAKAMGGMSHLAAALGITQPAVSQWQAGRRNVPPPRAIAIERLTGVRCERLRPDLKWWRTARGAVVGYQVRVLASNARKT